MPNNKLTEGRRIDIINKATQEWGRKDNDLLYLAVCEAIEAEVLRPVEQHEAAPAEPMPKLHCQNGGNVCLAGNRDGVCCPEDSCDIDDAVRKNPIPAPSAPLEGTGNGADERAAFDKALRETYQMVDPLNPPPAGTYYRGQHEGIIAALKTIRDNFDRARAPRTEVAGAVPAAVLDALRFYANGSHFNIDHDHQDFDTVSGEPANWLYSTRDDDTTMIEDGSIAKAALCGKSLAFEDPEQPVDGEVLVAVSADAAAAPEDMLNSNASGLWALSEEMDANGWKDDALALRLLLRSPVTDSILSMMKALQFIESELTEYLEGMPADETSRNLRDVARNALKVEREPAPHPKKE
jgi:hypothetical protein